MISSKYAIISCTMGILLTGFVKPCRAYINRGSFGFNTIHRIRAINAKGRNKRDANQQKKQNDRKKESSHCQRKQAWVKVKAHQSQGVEFLLVALAALGRVVRDEEYPAQPGAQLNRRFRRGAARNERQD